MNHSNRFHWRKRWLRAVIVFPTILVGASWGLRIQAQSPPSNPVDAAADAIQQVKPKVEAIVSMRTQKISSASVVPEHKQNYEFKVTGADWVDTGVVVGAGEIASFTASGDLTLNDGRTTTSSGADRGWKDLIRQFPLNQAKVGALIGRVSDMGASVPFSIGASAETPMPTTGKLYLRANLSSDLSATGEYTVKVKFSQPQTFKTDLLGTPVTAPINTVLTPDLFSEIPRRVSDTASGNGNPGDMVNFALLGTEQEVKNAYKAAGWVAVDKSVQDAILNGLLKTLSREAYTEMPMSTLFLFGRPQDMSFARADPLMVAAERHHLRVWKTDKTVAGRTLWVGSATHDIGFEKDQRTGGVTHKIDPEIDKERDYLLESFDAAGVYSSAAYVTPSNPLREARTATGGSFKSDGRIVVMALK